MDRARTSDCPTKEHRREHAAGDQDGLCGKFG
jgi:hypothetical protein